MFKTIQIEKKLGNELKLLVASSVVTVWYGSGSVDPLYVLNYRSESRSASGALLISSIVFKTPRKLASNLFFFAFYLP